VVKIQPNTELCKWSSTFPWNTYVELKARVFYMLGENQVLICFTTHFLMQKEICRHSRGIERKKHPPYYVLILSM